MKKGSCSKIHPVNMEENATCPPVSAFYFFNGNEILVGKWFPRKKAFFSRLSCSQIQPCDQILTSGV